MYTRDGMNRLGIRRDTHHGVIVAQQHDTEFDYLQTNQISVVINRFTKLTEAHLKLATEAIEKLLNPPVDHRHPVSDGPIFIEDRDIYDMYGMGYDDHRNKSASIFFQRLATRICIGKINVDNWTPSANAYAWKSRVGSASYRFYMTPDRMWHLRVQFIPGYGDLDWDNDYFQLPELPGPSSRSSLASLHARIALLERRSMQ